MVESEQEYQWALAEVESLMAESELLDWEVRYLLELVEKIEKYEESIILL